MNKFPQKVVCAQAVIAFYQSFDPLEQYEE